MTRAEPRFAGLPTRSFARNAFVALVICVILAACRSESQEHQDTTERRAGTVPVSYAAAAMRMVEDTESSIATVHAKRAPRIAAEVEGTLVEILVEQGDPVGEGEVLAVLDNTDYEIQFQRAEAEMRRLQIVVDQKRRDVERQKRLHESEHISRLLMENAQAELAALGQELAAARSDFQSAESRLQRTSVRAPYDGIIATRAVSEGDFVESGDTLFELSTNNALQVRIPLPEATAGRLETGLEVRLWQGDRPDEVHVGSIKHVAPQVDDESRSVTVIAEAPDGWRSGASINAEVVLEQRERIVLRSESIVRRPAGAIVYVLDGKIARERVVETGRRTGDWVEILSGLETGEKIVVDGAGFLTDETPVEAQPLSVPQTAGRERGKPIP